MIIAQEMHEMKEIGTARGRSQTPPSVRQCQIKSHGFTLFLSDELMRTIARSLSEDIVDVNAPSMSI